MDYKEKTIAQLVNECFYKLHRGVGKEKITGQEMALNVKFPSDYADFLNYTNGGDIYGGDITMFSVYDANSGISVRNTLGYVNRPGYRKIGNIPDSMVIIGEYNFGDCICIDRSTGNIVQWSHDEEGIYLEYDSFKEFLASNIEEHID